MRNGDRVPESLKYLLRKELNQPRIASLAHVICLPKLESSLETCHLKVDLANTHAQPDERLHQEKGRELILVIRLGEIANLRDIDNSTAPVILCITISNPSSPSNTLQQDTYWHRDSQTRQAPRHHKHRY